MPRTILVGDVHGCSDELEELLAKVAFSAQDRLCFVGDLIGRGPNPLRVLELYRNIGAWGVQGNHERNLLRSRASPGLDRSHQGLSPKHRELERLLGTEDWRLLESLPLALELIEHQAMVVHAGVDPSRSLQAQDPWVMTHVRSIDHKGRPSHHPGYESWATAYPGPTHVVFGHDALRGLQLHRHATGLDSGCVYGGRLSALVLERGQPVPPLSERAAAIIGIDAKKQYHDPTR